VHTLHFAFVTDGLAWSVGLSCCLSDGLSVWHDREACKNRWTDGDAVWVVDWSGGSKAARAYCFIWGCTMHTGATWRIQLNRPCAAAMRPRSNYF